MTGPSSFAHRFVPGRDGGPATTLLLLHGTGGDEDDLLPLGRRVLPGAALLSPRGRVLEGDMPRFFRRLAAGVFDLDSLFAETAALGTFVTEAAARYGFDSSRVVALGFSNGANIAATLLLRDPARLAGAALLRPMLPYRSEEEHAGLDGKPILIRAGRQDAMVPSAMVEDLASMLERARATVTTQWSPGGHGLTPEDAQAVAAWLGTLEHGRVTTP